MRRCVARLLLGLTTSSSSAPASCSPLISAAGAPTVHAPRAAAGSDVNGTGISRASSPASVQPHAVAAPRGCRMAPWPTSNHPCGVISGRSALHGLSHALPHATPTHHRSFFGSSNGSNSTMSDAEARANAEKMLELMASSPQMQRMMLSMMPAAARNPEMVQQILRDPGMKEQLVQMLAKQKMAIPSHVLASMTPSHMETTFDRAAKMGLDPQTLFQKLMTRPELLSKLQQPRIMSVFMDISMTPANAAKYKDDVETMKVIADIKAALGEQQAVPSSSPHEQPQLPQQPTTAAAPEPPPIINLGAPTDGPAAATAAAAGQQPEQPSTSSSPSPPDADPSSLNSPGTPMPPPPPGMPAAAGGASGLMAKMMADPELARRLQNPKIQAAVLEVSKSPWKTLKYVFDQEVMAVFTAMNNLMRGKDPWTGKKLPEKEK